MECPDCGKYLHDRATSCVCGWQMEIPMKNATQFFCDCGARLMMKGLCDSCTIKKNGLDNKELLDKALEETHDSTGTSLARMEGESKAEHVARCRAWLKSSGAMGRIGQC